MSDKESFELLVKGLVTAMVLFLGVHFTINKIKNDQSIAADTRRCAVALERLAGIK